MHLQLQLGGNHIVTTELIAALGIKLKLLIPGAFGAIISLRFFPGLNVWEKASTFLGGVGIAIYGAVPLVEWLELKESAEVGFALILGLFGMAVVAAVIKVIRDTDWSSIVKTKGGA